MFGYGGAGMAVKDEVLRMLEAHRGEALSGESVAECLSVSRASVWKAVRALRDEGHKIGASTRRGYRMEPDSDVLSEEGIRACLSEGSPVRGVVCLASVDSTNTYAKGLALSGGAHGTLVAADRQTAGRGRRGRSFFSPPGTGLYMSLILRPRIELERFQTVTIAVAVAVCRTIESLTCRRPRIKWVNDIYLEGTNGLEGADGEERKICGILTEAVSDVESGAIESVVVGIGLNVSTRDFAPDLARIAGSLFPGSVSRNRLAAGIAERLLDCQERLGDPELIREYRDRSLLLGREVCFIRDGAECRGVALDIDAQGCLLLREEGGTVVTLRSGEVYQVRPVRTN